MFSDDKFYFVKNAQTLRSNARRLLTGDLRSERHQ